MLSNARLEQAVELIDSIIAPSPIGYSIVDRSLRYVRISASLACLNGVSPADHIGRFMSEILHSDVWAIIDPLIRRALAGEMIPDVEFSVAPQDSSGLRTHYQRTLVPLRLDGEIVGVVTLARDMSSKTRAEQALERSKLRFQQLVDTAEEGIWIVDSDQRTTFVNPQMASMLGYAPFEMLGKSMYDYLDGETQRIAARYMKRRKDAGLDKREFRFRRKDGADAWVLIATTGMPSDDDEYFGTVGLFTDITSRKRAEIERECLLEQERAAREEAERNRHRIAATLESIHDGFVSIGTDWRFSYVNRPAAKMLERPVDELLGQNAWELDSCAVGQSLHEACRLAMSDQSAIEIEELEDRSGRWFGYQIFPSTEGVSIFFHEISERKRIESEKAELQRQKDGIVAQQRAFLRDMLWAVTDKRLMLCWANEDLPRKPKHTVWSCEIVSQNHLPELREQIREEGARLGFDRSRIQDLVIAASEAGMNAIIHGGGGTAWFGSADDGPMQVWFCDKGAGIAMDQMPRAVLERGFTTAGSMGHGMKMMLQTVDSIWLLTGPEGTTVVLEQMKIPDAQAI